MSGPALPPNPAGDPPTTPINPFAPSGAMTKGKGRGGPLFGPPRPPPNPAAPPFVSAQKRLRSDTISPLPTVRDDIVRKFPRSNYWTLRMAQAIAENGVDPTEYCTSDGPDLMVLGFLTEMQKEYPELTNNLCAQISALNDEILVLKLAATESPPFSSPAPKPMHTSAPPPTPPSSKPPPAVPATTWAMVAKKAKKTKNPPPANTMAPPATATAPTTKPSSQPERKTPTLRERRLLIKRDGTPLPTSNISLRDQINSALGTTYVQCIEGDTLNSLTLITMDTVKATTLNSKASTFLHLIPGTSSVHLETPMTQLIVHGIPTSHPLLTIGEELTTFNTGLILSQEPRWLTSNDRREGKSASSIVISITGPRAQDIAKRPRLSAFSTTYRLELRLRFNHLTQCARCQHFGHHTLRCTNDPICRWCTGKHLSSDHICPTGEDTIKGRPCSHTIVKCTSCSGYHDARFPKCPSRPPASDVQMDLR